MKDTQILRLKDIAEELNVSVVQAGRIKKDIVSEYNVKRVTYKHLLCYLGIDKL